MYVLFLMLDANFRLKSKDRGFEDIELSEGWSYFVPNSRYTGFMGKFKDQNEVSRIQSDGQRTSLRNYN